MAVDETTSRGDRSRRNALTRIPIRAINFLCIALLTMATLIIPAVASGAERLPAFRWSTSPVTAATVRFTWHSGCPVGPSALRLIHLSFVGFDGKTHLGSIVVNQRVVSDVVKVFSILYAHRFPIESMTPEDTFRGSDPASMAADNTSGFNCRYAVAPGPPTWSVHAYGEAIDVNPVQNPYLEGGRYQPAAGATYRDRNLIRPGMATPGGVLTGTFASVGWYWGGRWTASPDYQHFSLTGG